MRADDLLAIGALAARTGVSVATLRFYEEKGLVAPVRSAGGRRLYRRADIRRISFVLIAQSAGLELAEIAATLARLPEGRTPTAADWSAIAGGLRRRLDARIAALQATRARLDGCIGCGCLSLKACALYNAEDRAARRGQGPRWALGDDPAE
ncbi:MAG: redox-sensitive transcriptional activator SoxR [Alphaproteobacteria bacterium]|nr:redox-sensitive transcriptional activator SoxR [Alphaproteobacteria bacterium]